jgi:hypothetical protein
LLVYFVYKGERMNRVGTLLLISLMLVAWAPVFAQRGEIIAYPSTWRVEKEKSRFNSPDWVVLFSLPKNAEIRLVYSVGGPKDVGLFDKSGVAIDQNNKVIEVRVGWLGRRQTGYKGTIDDWARTLRVRYAAPFRPRG